MLIDEAAHLVKYHSKTNKIVLEKLIRPDNIEKEIYKFSSTYGYQKTLDILKPKVSLGLSLGVNFVILYNF